MTSVYVFALTTHTLPRLMVNGHQIEFVDLHGLHAAIERCPERPSVSEAALRSQHDIVMGLFDRADDLLPVRFGAWLDERELVDLVTARRAPIERAIELVRGRVQMTVRFPGFASSAALADPSADRTSGTAYLQARKEAAHAMPSEAALVSAAVRDLIVAEITSPGSSRTTVSLYHLIDRDSVAPYNTATARFEAPGVAISGPWPAFAFASDTWP
jgi:gas vesicle protein GvpL/GvpF